MEAITGKLHPRALADYQLVQRALGGSQQAYAALFERHRSAIFHFVSQRTRDSLDARDLTMEAFEKAFGKLSAYAPTHAFSTWLFKIALNHCIDRSRRKRQDYLNDPNWESLRALRDEALNAEEYLLRQERIQLVNSGLQQLNERYRRMLELRYYEEMSYEEISERLGVPLGTVKAQLFRAKSLLAAALGRPLAEA
jgi:RNA polymerase sigma-70 factor (ECF subfamily)